MNLNIIKFPDLIFLHTALFMHDFKNDNLPACFDSFFSRVNSLHNYNTRHASKSTFSLPKIRTNYGKFNIKFSGACVWNKIDESTKTLKKQKFKDTLFAQLITSYNEA